MSVLSQPETLSQLYDRDYFLWLQRTASLLREGRISEIDLANLVEEIEDMGRSEKRALTSNLKILIMHLFKYRYQPERRSLSWNYTIVEHRQRIRKLLQESPSLKPYLEDIFEGCYRDARELTIEVLNTML